MQIKTTALSYTLFQDLKAGDVFLFSSPLNQWQDTEEVLMKTGDVEALYLKSRAILLDVPEDAGVYKAKEVTINIAW